MKRSGRTLLQLGVCALVVACSKPGPAPVASATSAPTASVPPAAPSGESADPSGRSKNVLDEPQFSVLAPDRYFVEPVGLPVRIHFTIEADGWRSWIGSYKDETGADAHRHIGLSVANVIGVVVDGCTDHRARHPAVGPTVDDLAAALASIAPFVVSQPPRTVEAFGFSGMYLELIVPEIQVRFVATESYFDECAGQQLMSWIAPPLSYAFYGYSEPGQHEEFWIVDVEGSRLVIEANWSPDGPPEDLAELRAILDSIEIEVL